jgi:uncharacterized protein
VDTNLLLRMAAAGERSPLFVAWDTGRFTLISSNSLLAELEDVFARPRLRRYLPQPRGQLFVDLVLSRAVFVEPVVKHPRCRDPKDDKVIAVAIAAGADFIVTADKDLYDDAVLVNQLDSLGIRIVQRDDFLGAL